MRGVGAWGCESGGGKGGGGAWALPHHLTFVNGEMKLVIQTRPASANSLATSAIRRIFSSLSPGENPRFLLRP